MSQGIGNSRERPRILVFFTPIGINPNVHCISSAPHGGIKGHITAPPYLTALKPHFCTSPQTAFYLSKCLSWVSTLFCLDPKHGIPQLSSWICSSVSQTGVWWYGVVFEATGVVKSYLLDRFWRCNIFLIERNKIRINFKHEIHEVSKKCVALGRLAQARSNKSLLFPILSGILWWKAYSCTVGPQVLLSVDSTNCRLKIFGKKKFQKVQKKQNLNLLCTSN